jgi:hypothetical protein
MNVLLVKPKKAAYEAEIGNSLDDLQAVVGGDIQAVYPYDDPVAIVCNDEGKLIGLPLNRALRDENGDVYDIIAGTFFVCGLGEGDFDSLPPELMEKYKAEFGDPQMFHKINGKILTVKVTEQYIDTHDRLQQKHDRER